VIGQGTVTIVDANELTYTNAEESEPNSPLSLHNLRLHILSHGDGYHLHQNKAIGKSNKKMT
jgi:cyanophycinase